MAKWGGGQIFFQKRNYKIDKNSYFYALWIYKRQFLIGIYSYALRTAELWVVLVNIYSALTCGYSS